MIAALEQLRRGTRSSGAQLSAGLRRRLVAIRHPAGLCALAQGAGRPQVPPAAALAARVGDACHHRLSPAHHPRRNRTGPRRGRGWRDANAAGTRPESNRSAARKSSAADDLRHHPVFLEYFGLRSLEDLPAADELRRIPVHETRSARHRRPGPGHRAAGTTTRCRAGG